MPPETIQDGKSRDGKMEHNQSDRSIDYCPCFDSVVFQ